MARDLRPTIDYKYRMTPQEWYDWAYSNAGFFDGERMPDFEVMPGDMICLNDATGRLTDANGLKTVVLIVEDPDGGAALVESATMECE